MSLVLLTFLALVLIHTEHMLCLQLGPPLIDGEFMIPMISRNVCKLVRTPGYGKNGLDM